ncbi:MAG: 30S ribosomal protein S8 [Candidatus Yanofskybacteria bacterium]|nr:30S ribosomal protein S8 [Candidatus Yanofskybacteria bacterium]
MVDPIADMLTRIRNAQTVKKHTVEVPFSRLKYAVAKILEKKGFVKNVEFKGRQAKKIILIELQYQDGRPAITGIKRVSKPGLRVYAGMLGIAKAKTGRGMAILSTSHGIMTETDAKRKNIGGELLCEIW